MDAKCYFDLNLVDVTILPEFALFSAFIIFDIAIFIKLGINFRRIKQWELMTLSKGSKLICINSCLALTTLLLLTSHWDQLILYQSKQLKDDPHSYFKLKLQIYYYSQYCFINNLNITILISSKTWLQLLQIKYMGTTYERYITLITSLCRVLIIFSSVIFTIQIILYALCISTFNFHWAIIVVTLSVGIVFSISALLFSKHILSMHVIPLTVRRKMTIVTKGVFASAIMRCLWDLLQTLSSSKEYIEEWRDYDQQSGENQTLFWFFYLIVYCSVANYFPIILLAILYCPDINRQDNFLNSYYGKI